MSVNGSAGAAVRYCRSLRREESEVCILEKDEFYRVDREELSKKVAAGYSPREYTEQQAAIGRAMQGAKAISRGGGGGGSCAPAEPALIQKVDECLKFAYANNSLLEDVLMQIRGPVPETDSANNLPELTVENNINALFRELRISHNKLEQAKGMLCDALGGVQLLNG